MWLGTDLSLSRQVAVKLLKPNLAADPVVAERFRREAIAVAQLSHPNIVAVYDAIEEQIGGERRQAVVMQLVNGKSLRQLLDEQKRLSPDLTMHIGSCVAAALDAAHRANLVHRDVKPGNILITPDGRVLLTDFGIAKGLTGTGEDDLTSPNVMMGTAKYLSPEQVRGRKLDGRADLYSLGLVLYECLAGRVPFLGETDADTALARLNREATDLTRLRPTLPLGLAPLIHRLLARKPDDRYTSGAEVRSELQRIASQPKTDVDHSTEVPSPARTTGSTPRTGPRTTGSVPTVPNPARTTGSQQAVKGRPAGAPTRADRTPTSPNRPRQQPNRKFEHRTGPSMLVVTLLLVAAFVVGLILWVTMGTGDSGAPSSTGLPDDTSGVSASSTGQVVTPAPGGIVSLKDYDPEGTDGAENPDLVSAAVDGDPNTGWRTVCYDSRNFAGTKTGVGLVADLGSARTGTFRASIANGPFQLQILTAADSIPADINGWTSVGSYAGDTPDTLTAVLSSPARYVLVWFKQIPQDPECQKNPYRGTVTELAFG